MCLKDIVTTDFLNKRMGSKKINYNMYPESLKLETLNFMKNFLLKLPVILLCALIRDNHCNFIQMSPKTFFIDITFAIFRF